MTFNLYNWSGDRNALHKSLGSGVSMSGTLTEPSNVVRPTIVVDSCKNESGGFDPATMNYAYIPEFHRYYFVEEATALTEYLWQIRLKSDVLMSFQSQIEGLGAYGIRTASIPRQSPEIEDPYAPHNACDYVTRYDFHWSGGGTATFTLDSDNYVLITSG